MSDMACSSGCRGTFDHAARGIEGAPTVGGKTPRKRLTKRYLRREQAVSEVRHLSVDPCLATPAPEKLDMKLDTVRWRFPRRAGLAWFRIAGRPYDRERD